MSLHEIIGVKSLILKGKEPKMYLNPVLMERRLSQALLPRIFRESLRG